jgi:hypothetical protein
VKGLPGSADLRRLLHAVNSLDEVEGIFGDYLRNRERYEDAPSDTADVEAVAV